MRSVTLVSWPDLPTVYAARDVAVEKMAAITTRTDDRSTGIHTLRDMNRPGFTGGQNSRRIARYGTDIKEEDFEAVFTRCLTVH